MNKSDLGGWTRVVGSDTAWWDPRVSCITSDLYAPVAHSAQILL